MYIYLGLYCHKCGMRPRLELEAHTYRTVAKEPGLPLLSQMTQHRLTEKLIEMLRGGKYLLLCPTCYELREAFIQTEGGERSFDKLMTRCFPGSLKAAAERHRVEGATFGCRHWSKGSKDMSDA